MTREDIIRMAREAGLTGLVESEVIENFERFAALVAEAERKAEREACARVAESMRPNGGRAWDDAQRACFSALTDLAAAIRARGSE